MVDYFLTAILTLWFRCVEILAPYHCFYTGSVLLAHVKDAIVKQNGQKSVLLNDYCQAMEDKAFTARQTLIDQTMHGSACIDQFATAYSDPNAAKFDPISREITNRGMCAEFVKEINTL